jgi:F-type H+-transporting ATPase subunit b
MIHLFTFLTSEEIGRGGLFDFGATLPLLIVQFTLLTFILNIILYNPILNVIAERNQYLLETVSKASDLLTEADSITKKYELDLQNKRKQIQTELSTSEETYKQIWGLELQTIRVECNDYVTKYNEYLLAQKENDLQGLQSELVTLTRIILYKLFSRNIA